MRITIKRTAVRVMSVITAMCTVFSAAGCGSYAGDDSDSGRSLWTVTTIESSFKNRDQTVSGAVEGSAASSLPEMSVTVASEPPVTDNSFTLMVYMCGSDIEKNTGNATKDIFEMIAGCGQNKNVNVIVQTGGSSRWQNDIVAADRCQRYRITKDGMILIDDTLGQKSMGKGDSLRDFISFTAKKYPAQRYGLVLWDHGGGSAGGWCYDENYPMEMMSMPALCDALASAGASFDLICFDACLMGGFETCLALAPYTDRLIASEEVIPNCGLYYTDMISAVYSDPTISADELGRIIVDSYIGRAYEASPYKYSTLGVFDTKKVVNEVLPALNKAAQGCSSQLNNGGYADLSLKRSKLKEMSDGENYIDMYAFAESENNTELINRLDTATVYFKATDNYTGDHGLNLYYPYHDLSMIDNMDSLYVKAGISSGYTDYLHSFANVMAGGQLSAESPSAEESYSDYEWYDDSEAYAPDYYEEYNSSTDIDKLEIIKRNGQFVLDLSDEDREKISKIELVCMLPFEEGFIALGTDDYYVWDEENDLIVGYDKTWVFLDGQIVPFFNEESYSEDDHYISYGYVPCEYNGVKAQIIIVWSTELPQGFVAGVRPVYDDSSITTKGLYDLRDGDTFKVSFDLYDENMNYLTAFTDEREFTVDGELKVSYEDISSIGDTYIFYRIYDIFNNVYTTESVTYNAS